ncbi:MAG: hypothetical protein AAFN10_12240 [Bacteroidota bacterium]
MTRAFSKAEDLDLKRMALLSLSNYGQKVSKKEWKTFADEQAQQYLIYEAFQEEGRLTDFPFKKLKEEDLARAYVLNQIYQEEDLEPDSLILIESRTLSNQGQDLRFYVYKFGWQSEDESIGYWHLGLAGGFALETKQPIIAKDLGQLNWAYDKEIKLQERIEGLFKRTTDLLQEVE